MNQDKININLQLTSTQDLIDELMARMNGIAIVYKNVEGGNEESVRTAWDDKLSYPELIGMISMLGYQLEHEYHDRFKED